MKLICKKLSFILSFTILAFAAFSFAASAETVAERQARLQAELNRVEAEIAEQESILSAKQKEAASFERDIAILDARIKEAKLKIKAKNISIEKLGKDIRTKKEIISDLTEKIDRSKISLAQIIRKTDEMNSSTLAEAVLSGDDITDFFIDEDSYFQVKRSLNDLLNQIRADREQNESEKDALDKKQQAEIDAKVVIEAEKRKIEKSEKEKKELLNANKVAQKGYQALIRERQKRAAEIKSMLFSLRDIAPIKFGDALQYALNAQQKTGVRPAFLLAILKQETNLGANVGSCYLSDKTTGAGIGIKSGNAISRVMHPTRDVPVFLNLMSSLGMNYATTPVSCPFSEGWGGGMGPAQFIASTWNLFASKVANIMGKPIANPWDPQDAFMASAIYLKDLGAANGGYSAERNAACRYYSGRKCDARRPINYTYGDQVMAKAQNIQETLIDPLNSI